MAEENEDGEKSRKKKKKKGATTTKREPFVLEFGTLFEALEVLVNPARLLHYFPLSTGEGIQESGHWNWWGCGHS